MKLLVVVQARVSSTRLPGKVLLPLAGEPLLQRQLERIRAARTPFLLCVATTTSPSDEPIRRLCRRLEVPVFDGHPSDCLERHYRAAEALGANAVAKIPSDCPLIDPAAIDRVLGHFIERSGECDFVTNLYPPTWPDGNDVEVMTFDALRAAFHEAARPFEREHTTPFIWERPERFRIENVRWETGLDFSKSHRFTIDYPEDYALLNHIYGALFRPERPIFSLAEVLALLAERPELAATNARFTGQSWHAAHVGELRSVVQGTSGVEWRVPE